MQAAHRFYVGDKLTLTKALDGIPIGSEAEVKSIDFHSVQLVFKIGIWGNHSASLVQAHFAPPPDFFQRVPNAITDIRRPETNAWRTDLEMPKVRQTAI